MSRKNVHKKLLRDWPLYFFILPSLALVLTFQYYPVANGFYHSVFEWGGGEAKRFTGWENYRRAFTDPTFIHSFKVIGYLLIFNIIKMWPSIIMAVLIHRLKSDRWQYLYRVLLLVPMIVPGLVTLFIWKFLLDPNIGGLNVFVETTGLKSALVALDNFFGWGVFFKDVPIAWLGQPELILPTFFIWGFPWIGMFGVLMYLAGLQAIGNEVYEAADLEGIGPFQKFFYIELPLILTQIRIGLILMVMGTLGGFGFQLLLLNEGGGPGGRGMVPGLWIYNRSFVAGEFGYGCALGVILGIIIFGLTYINNRYIRVDR